MDNSPLPFPHHNPPQAMSDNFHFYSHSPAHYSPAQHYVQQPQLPAGMHVVPAPPRQDTSAQRKRPKYTRSKTGCLTCRQKKIKCDETKPNCMRCTHGQRECTWPEGVPARKKTTTTVKRESASDGTLDVNHDARPSTAGSSGMSESSTPSTRDHTPPGREPPMELGLPPILSRRSTDSSLNVSSLPSEVGPIRRQSVAAIASASSHPYAMHPAASSHSLPAIHEPDVSYSSSAHQYPHAYSNAHMHHNQHYSQSNSVAVSRVSSHHHGHSHAMRSEALSNSGQWNHAPLLQHVDPIEPFFTTAQERNLIYHYCANAMNIVMAIPSENPVLAANLQFVLSRPRGSDPAVESLRMAMLGVAAVHQSFLMSRNAAGRAVADESMQVAESYRSQSKQLLVRACARTEGIQSDASLGAAVTLALIDILAGGHNWFKTLNVVKTLISRRGGPAVLLARSPHPKPGSVTGVSRARLLLEIVAVYEIFGCLVSGEAPTLLSPNANSWWFDQANSDDHQSYVESKFGMSRGFIPVLAQITTFLNRTATNQSGIREVSSDANGSPGSDEANEARTLYDLLGSWTALSENLPDRVRVGNLIYQNATQISLLRDVLQAPPDNPVVQQHCSQVLSLCLECGLSEMALDLTWPVIIAGSVAYSADRTRVLALFETFRKQCCYEIETAEHVVLQVWKRLDADLPRADWRSVMQDLNLNVLLI